MAVAHVIGSQTVPAIATGQEAIEAREPTGLQCLAQPQCALHQCTGCCSKPVQACEAAPGSPGQGIPVVLKPMRLPDRPRVGWPQFPAQSGHYSSQSSIASSQAAVDLVGSPCQVVVKEQPEGHPIVSSASGPKVGIEVELVLVEDGDILAMETLAMVGCDAQGL